MSSRDKLIRKIKNNPKVVRFSDACKVAKWLGFQSPPGKGKGGHCAFSRTGERMGLNFQDKGGGRIPAYQADQLIQMIDLYYVAGLDENVED